VKKLYSGIQRFIRDEEGVTAIEYALIAALIAVVIITAVTNTGTEVENVFNKVVNALKSS
jgi:pilus assembly protein Flp/PilA